MPNNFDHELNFEAELPIKELSKFGIQKVVDITHRNQEQEDDKDSDD